MNYKLTKQILDNIRTDNGENIIFESWNSKAQATSSDIRLFDEKNSHKIYDERIGFFEKLVDLETRVYVFDENSGSFSKDINFREYFDDKMLIYGLHHFQSKRYYTTVLIYETCIAIKNHKANWKVIEYLPDTFAEEVRLNNDLNLKRLQEVLVSALNLLGNTYADKTKDEAKSSRQLITFFGFELPCYTIVPGTAGTWPLGTAVTL